MNPLLIIGAIALFLMARSQNVQAQPVSVFKQAVTGLENSLQVWRYDPRGLPYDAQFTAVEQQYNLPAGLLRRVAWQESRFNPDAVSSAGAVGLMQFMPATAAFMGFDPKDPNASIAAAGRYLSQLYQSTGNWSNALGAYNWGIGNIMTRGLSAAPAETQQYVASITSDLGLA